MIAILGGGVSASVTYTLNERAARRERQAKAFAEALNAVEDYAEMPYRIRRRRDTPEARYNLTDEVSKIQSRLAYHQALLQIEAPEVAVVYAALVRAAKIQAGGQMQQAWQQAVLTTDAEMNLQVRYPRDEIDNVRGTCIETMRDALWQHRTRHAPTLPTANSDRPDLAPPPAGHDHRKKGWTAQLFRRLGPTRVGRRAERTSASTTVTPSTASTAANWRLPCRWLRR